MPGTEQELLFNIVPLPTAEELLQALTLISAVNRKSLPRWPNLLPAGVSLMVSESARQPTTQVPAYYRKNG